MATRIQRKRTKDYTQPLGTIYVGRPTKFGNPFKLSPDGWILYRNINRKVLSPWIFWSVCGGFTTQDIVDLYEKWIIGELANFPGIPIPPNPKELKGANLSCWCPIGEACHVDILLKLANK
jgi:hypothetical protein